MFCYFVPLFQGAWCPTDLGSYWSGLIAKLADSLLGLQERSLVHFHKLFIDGLEVGQHSEDSGHLLTQLFHEGVENESFPFFLRIQLGVAWVQDEVHFELGENWANFAHENIHLFDIVLEHGYFLDVEINPFEVLFLVSLLIGDNFINIFRFGQLFDFGWSNFRCIFVPILVKGIFEVFETFLEGDSVGIKEGDGPGLYGLFILGFLFLVEGGQLSFIVGDLFLMFFVGYLLSFDSHGQVGKLEILLFQPVYNLDVIVALAGGFVLL